MSKDYNIDDDFTAKAYDSKLMKRLLSYARPYWKLLLLTIFIMVVVTGLELLRPYILKVTIDDYINSNTSRIYKVEASNSPNLVLYNNSKFIREKDLEKSPVISGPYRLSKDKTGYSLKSEEEVISLTKDDYKLFRQEDIRAINKLSLIFLLSIVLAFFLNYLQAYILNYTSQKIIFNIRNEVFQHIQGLSVSFFDKNPIGKLVTRVTNDTESLNDLYTNVLVTLFKDIFILVGIVIIMVKMDLKLALLSMTLIPVVFVASLIFRKKIRLVYRKSRFQLSLINSTLNENITGIRTIQIFNQEGKIKKEFDKLNKDYLATSKEEISVFAVFRPSIEVIKYLGIGLLVLYGGSKTLVGALEFGVLYAFIDYLQRFFEPILDLTEKYNILQSSMASSERIFDILDTNDHIENTSKPVRFKNLKGKIEFKNVWFAYVGEDWVLKDLSFTINPGEAVAFVGSTGAGKTSIINLITRFYDIQKGEILIDGVNIKNYDKYELRRSIGVVLQDVFLFTGNIEDNIRLNNKNITRDQVIKVAKDVNAHDFISKLDKGYDEPVMERGVTLSTGERQLLSFARTLAYDPDILILDEATSNIDTETEILIQEGLNKLIKGRTTIAVAHRLSTIQHVNKIIVLSKGEIVEEGSHQDLLANESTYYDLYQLQYKEELKTK